MSPPRDDLASLRIDVLLFQAVPRFAINPIETLFFAERGGRIERNGARRLAMSSFDRMLGWFPHTSREWIELIIVTVLLWLLMMAIFELELV